MCLVCAAARDTTRVRYGLLVECVEAGGVVVGSRSNDHHVCARVGCMAAVVVVVPKGHAIAGSVGVVVAVDRTGSVGVMSHSDTLPS